MDAGGPGHPLVRTKREPISSQVLASGLSVKQTSTPGAVVPAKRMPGFLHQCGVASVRSEPPHPVTRTTRHAPANATHIALDALPKPIPASAPACSALTGEQSKSLRTPHEGESMRRCTRL